MQERNCVFYRLVAALNVVPYQLLKFGTTLNIHSHRLPQFQGLSTRNWRTWYRLDKWLDPDSHQSKWVSRRGGAAQKRTGLTRNHGGDIYALAVDEVSSTAWRCVPFLCTPWVKSNIQNRQVKISLSCGPGAFGSMAQSKECQLTNSLHQLFPLMESRFLQQYAISVQLELRSISTMELQSISLRVSWSGTRISICVFSSRSTTELPSFAFATYLKRINREHSAAQTGSPICKLR